MRIVESIRRVRVSLFVFIKSIVNNKQLPPTKSDFMTQYNTLTIEYPTALPIRSLYLFDNHNNRYAINQRNENTA